MGSAAVKVSAKTGAVTERKSFCRICLAHCGMVLSLDENNRLVDIRADREDKQTLGYACFKGLQAVEQHNGEARILHPLKRQPDGSFARIGLEQALDEIAAKIREIIDEDGPEAISLFRGGGAYFHAAGVMLGIDMMETLGSHKMFSPNTIDQSAKYVAVNRIGMWPPGLHPQQTSDVTLMIGGNPLVSVTAFDVRNPVKRLKEAKARGMKLLIVDPRLSETARFADLFLQPLPGEDTTIVAGMIRYVFENGLEDKDFLARNAADTEKLREAVAPFTPEYVAKRARVPVEQFIAVIDAFARAKRGTAMTSTGPDMGPHSNLAEHLVYCLNIVCGRFVREGERILNPGVILPRYPRACQVVPAPRPWDQGFKSRVGDYGMIWGELPTGIMADEMLQPGPGRVRAMINHGGNPATSVPDQRKVVKALSSLDLLVSMEPYMTPTAKLSHYILPPVLQYERPDLPLWLYEYILYPEPFTRYTRAIASPPADSEVVDDGYVYWSLAKRLGIQMKSCGVEIDMSRPPSADELLATVARYVPMPFADVQSHEMGTTVDVEPQFAEPGNPAPDDKFTLMSDDVFAELKQVAQEKFGAPVVLSTGEEATFRTAVRRSRNRFNSTGGFLSGVRKREPYNTALMNPDDMKDMNVVTGDYVRVASDTGVIKLKAEADDTLRRGVVTILHGFGDLPDDETYLERGISPNLLISTDRDLQTINATPRMTAIPVAIRPTN